MALKPKEDADVASRRRWLKYSSGTAIALAMGGTGCGRGTKATPIEMRGQAANGPRSNFRDVYLSPPQEQEFELFLKNVFHLYPERELHGLIQKQVKLDSHDRDVYRALARKMPQIAPFLSELRYTLPALRKQKQVMRRQTGQLLGNRDSFNGYLEIGSHGRYLSALRDIVQIDGPNYMSTTAEPTFSLEDMIDREQVGFSGSHIPLNRYAPISSRDVPAQSIELATVYIGFHHCAPEKRDAYVESIRNTIAPGGILILRDHDVDRAELQSLVSLAHDVFNAGTGVSWEGNARELRHFYSVDFIVDYLEQRGFKAKPGRLLQDGDPTRNTLMAFEKA